MKILIDMNLSPAWLSVFQAAGWEACHWSRIGNHSAPDREVLDWAAKNGCLVFTHDLDFGTLLVSDARSGPSVVQLRGHETSPLKVGSAVLTALKQFTAELERGALITIDASKMRARILPLLGPTST